MPQLGLTGLTEAGDRSQASAGVTSIALLYNTLLLYCAELDSGLTVALELEWLILSAVRKWHHVL